MPGVQGLLARIGDRTTKITFSQLKSAGHSGSAGAACLRGLDSLHLWASGTPSEDEESGSESNGDKDSD